MTELLDGTQLSLIVHETIRESLSLEPDLVIHGQMELSKDLGCDSLDLLAIAIGIKSRLPNKKRLVALWCIQEKWTVRELEREVFRLFGSSLTSQDLLSIIKKGLGSLRDIKQEDVDQVEESDHPLQHFISDYDSQDAVCLALGLEKELSVSLPDGFGMETVNEMLDVVMRKLSIS